MNTSIITLTSVTYAMKVKRFLEHLGASSKVLKVDEIDKNGGCTYGIKIPAKYFYDVIVFLKQNDIKYSVK